MDKGTVKELARETVLEMIKDGGLQIETYIEVGNYRADVVTIIGTNEGEYGYEKLVENREEIELNELIEKMEELK